MVENDPLVKAVQDHCFKAGKTQGQFDDFMATAAALAQAGVFGEPLDAAAELAKLGDNGEGRRREVEIFADALKARGDGFDEGMHGELMSLAPTADGVRLVEYLRKLAGPGLEIVKPETGGVDPVAAAQAKAKEMATDPRYGRDRAFTAEADRAWKAAFPGSR